MLAKQIIKPVNRGYFEAVEDYALYIERKEENTYIAKRGNITYTEYCLSDKDLEFILNALVFIWNESTNQVVRKRSRGKCIEVIKEKTMSLKINNVTMIKGLDKTESRKLYAMFVELKKYGVTNKLI